MVTKKRLLPIFVAVLMVFAMIPMAARTVFAEETAEGPVVTPQNFTDYFEVNEDSASLKESITDAELTFRGDFTESFDAPLYITIDRSVKIEGDQASFKDVSFAITANDVSVSGLSIVDTETPICAFEVRDCEGTVLADNMIDVTSVNEGPGFSAAVNIVCAKNMSLNDNRICYIGKTNGDFINAALRAEASEHVTITNNTFDITMVSAYVRWDSAGGVPVSEGLTFNKCHDLKLSSNTISIGYDGVLGSYDTINGIDIAGTGSSDGSDGTADILIDNNKISVTGHTYAYGLLLSANDYMITGNEFTIDTDEYYAAAIDLENAASGTISGNTINTKTRANGIVAYGIYGGFSSSPAEDLTIRGNEFNLKSKIAYGFEMTGSIAEGKVLYVEGNTFKEEGDYLAGIAVDAAGEIAMTGNTIAVPGSNQNEYSLWEAFYNKWRTSYGIGIMKNAGCHARISENTITSSDAGIISLSSSELTNNIIEAGGAYAIDVFEENKDTTYAAYISGNTLTAADKTGDSAVNATDVDTVENSDGGSQPQPATQTITASNITKTYGNAAFSLGAKTSGDGTLTYMSDNSKVATVSSAGKVTIKGAGTAKITISASATANYKTASKTITVTINKAANPLKIGAKTATVKYSKLKKKAQTLAVTKVIKFTKKGQGTMSFTKTSGNKKITINKKTGKVTVKKGLKKGTYKVKIKVKATGNANYKASAVKTVTFKIKVK